MGALPLAWQVSTIVPVPSSLEGVQFCPTLQSSCEVQVGAQSLSTQTLLAFVQRSGLHRPSQVGEPPSTMRTNPPSQKLPPPVPVLPALALLLHPRGAAPQATAPSAARPSTAALRNEPGRLRPRKDTDRDEPGARKVPGVEEGGVVRCMMILYPS